jgi:hypothetical protein
VKNVQVMVRYDAKVDDKVDLATVRLHADTIVLVGKDGRAEPSVRWTGEHAGPVRLAETVSPFEHALRLALVGKAKEAECIPLSTDQKWLFNVVTEALYGADHGAKLLGEVIGDLVFMAIRRGSAVPKCGDVDDAHVESICSLSKGHDPPHKDDLGNTWGPRG